MNVYLKPDCLELMIGVRCPFELAIKSPAVGGLVVAGLGFIAPTATDAFRRDQLLRTKNLKIDNSLLRM